MRHAGILLLLLTTTLFGQVRMISFVPKTKAFAVYYPEHYSVNNEEENITTLTDATSGLNITLSSYTLAEPPTDTKLIDLLSGFVTEIKKEDWKSYQSKFDNLIEGTIKKKEDNWIWWAVSQRTRVVILSVNKATDITEEDVKLLHFIIEHLDIYD